MEKFNRAKYKMYLNSKQWKDKSEECKKIYGYKCFMCESEESLQTHHLNYDNVFNELQDDLVCLCEGCHKKEHGVVEFKKKIKGGYVQLYHKKFAEVLELLKSQNEIVTFNYITKRFTYMQTEVSLKFSDIEKHIPLSKSMFHGLINKLINSGYLVKIGSERSSVYRLNPFCIVPFRADGELLQKEWDEIKREKEIKNERS